MEKIKSIVKKRGAKILLFILADVIILCFSSYLALKLRFDFGAIPGQYTDCFIDFLFIDFGLMLIYFSLLNLYTSVWDYASIDEVMSIFVANLLLEVTSYVFHLALKVPVPRSYFIIKLFMMFTLVSLIRFSYRISRAILIKLEGRNKSKNTMLIGAGEAGRLIINELRINKKDYDSKIVCIIDDNKELKGTYLRGIKICGNRRTIVENAEKYSIDEIIIAMPSQPKSEIAKIVNECQKTKCKIKILPPINKMMDSNVLSNVKDLSYEDFLGRDQIVVDNDEIENSIKDKIVLVTGGGGSIGSELCRQIAKCNPKTLIIFDIYENNAYEIQQELFRNYPNLDLNTIIGSVRDYDRLEKVFIDFKPNIVFHAAAYKHVPLMEVSPNEAIKNNCLGTLNACKLANKYKVDKFVLISTDKAVRPTNVMGASKRICEMIMQTYDKKSKHTDYVAVRFGNVLGSNGSVIPLFLKQIENGGPVTVTHRKITRFFMTIPEAVSLVLQAGCYATGGEIFVLDMGQPVKIYDLAKQLIRYKGYEPNADIKIEITGLRPGEKLYEELLMDEEGLEATPNKLIHIGKPIKIKETFLDDLDELIKEAYKNEGDIKDKVAKVVTTYHVDKERKGK